MADNTLQPLLPPIDPPPPPKNQAWFILFALICSNLFALFIGFVFEFLSLRGVVDVSASRFVLVGAWACGVVIICAFAWGRGIRAKIPTVGGGALLLAILLWGLDAWAPKLLPVSNTPEEPVIHVEPEGGIVWSTGQTLGVFTIHLHNTGGPVNVQEIEKEYFLAQRSTSIILKRLPSLVDDHKGLLPHEANFPLVINFNPYMDDINEVSANFKEGPSLPGVYIVARLRRQSDGKDFEVHKAYGLLVVPYYGQSPKPHGVALYSEGTNMDTPLGARLPLSDVVPFLALPERWISITKEISVDKNGKMHIRQY